MNTYKLKHVIVRLIYCSVLIGATDFNLLVTIGPNKEDVSGYTVDK